MNCALGLTIKFKLERAGLVNITYSLPTSFVFATVSYKFELCDMIDSVFFILKTIDYLRSNRAVILVQPIHCTTMNSMKKQIVIRSVESIWHCMQRDTETGQQKQYVS